LHVYDGEFEAARRYLARWHGTVAGSTDAWRQVYAAHSKIDFELELGEADAAAKTARALATASRVWLPDDQFNTQDAVEQGLYLTGQLTREEFARRKQAAPAGGGGASVGTFMMPGVRWFTAYVSSVKDAADAENALRFEPSDRPLVDPVQYAVHFDALLGRTYLLGGRLEDALRQLKRVPAACGYAESLRKTQGVLWLGEALAQAGDREGECEAYGAVLKRWGREPRSVTARLARARAEASRCPK
jgi:eukaryotic-like serine/threonine-protein kinase